MFVQCVYTVYGVLFSPLWLKSVPGWLAISVSTWQQFRVGQIVWFGWLSAISQLASRVVEGWGVWHSVTQPYTTWPRWRDQGGGLCSLPLVYRYGLHAAHKPIHVVAPECCIDKRRITSICHYSLIWFKELENNQILSAQFYNFQVWRTYSLHTTL